MSYPCRLCDLEYFFKRSSGYISESIELARLHLQSIASPLVDTFDYRRIVPFLPVFAQAMRNKGSLLVEQWGNLDGCFVPFCRPGWDGYNGPDQQAQYSGHKKCHGNNHQGVTTPDGLIVEMHGPYPGRTNDLRMLRESQLLQRCHQHCNVNGIQYALFGDRGYRHGDPALQVPFQGAAVSAQQRQYNSRMALVRISVEWAFGNVKKLFAFVDFKKNQKLHLMPVASYWQIAVLLTNCHSCLYGNETSQYFQVPTPTLNQYLYSAFH